MMTEHSEVDFLHEVGSRIAAADPLHEVLDRIVSFISDLVQCDSCFVYILEDDELVLRASQNPHDDVVDSLRLRAGQGITGWVSEHRQPVALAHDACQDPRFKFFSELPEDCYEAFLSVPIMFRGRVVGIINVQHRLPRTHTPREIKLISTVGFLVGAEIEAARLGSEVSHLSDQLATRKLVERAKGILQRDPGVDGRTLLPRVAAPKPPETQTHERGCRGHYSGGGSERKQRRRQSEIWVIG